MKVSKISESFLKTKIYKNKRRPKNEFRYVIQQKCIDRVYYYKNIKNILKKYLPN